MCVCVCRKFESPDITSTLLNIGHCAGWRLPQTPQGNLYHGPQRASLLPPATQETQVAELQKKQ